MGENLDKAKGRVKQAAGDLTDDDDLKREGKADELAGKVKGAIDTMTLGLAREVAAEGIRVNAVRPGLTYTDIHASGGEPHRVDRLKGTVPLQRGAQPVEQIRSSDQYGGYECD